MSRGRVVRRPLAVADLIELADYIAQDSLDAAERFLGAADAEFERLASMPQMGEACWFFEGAASELRYWPVPKFAKRLIFYRPLEDGVEIVRVLHSARDVSQILQREEE